MIEVGHVRPERPRSQPTGLTIASAMPEAKCVEKINDFSTWIKVIEQYTSSQIARLYYTLQYSQKELTPQGIDSSLATPSFRPSLDTLYNINLNRKINLFRLTHALTQFG